MATVRANAARNRGEIPPHLEQIQSGHPHEAAVALAISDAVDADIDDDSPRLDHLSCDQCWASLLRSEYQRSW